MKAPITERMTAVAEGEFCLFLVGMRFNCLWKVHRWFPVFLAMPRMIRELSAQPQLGFLGGHVWFGRTIIFVQYWRSVDHLMRYASARDRAHLPAWAAFTRDIGDRGDVGIWHETYRVAPGTYETIYHNMPPFGLGAVAPLVPATGHRQHARDRLSPAPDGTDPAEPAREP